MSKGASPSVVSMRGATLISGGTELLPPVPIPATDGQLFADGLVLTTYVEGSRQRREADERSVAIMLRCDARRHETRQGRKGADCKPG